MGTKSERVSKIKSKKGKKLRALGTLIAPITAIPEVASRLNDAIDKESLDPLEDIDDEKWPVTSNLRRVAYETFGDQYGGENPLYQSWFGLAPKDDNAIEDGPVAQIAESTSKKTDAKKKSVRERTKERVRQNASTDEERSDEVEG